MNEFTPGFRLYTKAMISEFEEFTDFRRNRKILLVEGEDDEDVLNRYRFYNKNTDEDDDFEIGISEGKRNVLNHKDILAKHDHYVACLLDYDYSPLLNEVSSDSRVYHYPYFELENLIMSDEILKKLLNYYVNCTNLHEYNDFISALSNFENYFNHQIKIKLFIDVNHRKKAIELSDSQRHQLKTLANFKVTSILRNNSEKYKDMTPQEKLESFYSEKLSEIELSIHEIEEVICLLCDPIFNFSIHPYKNEFNHKFKYFVDGKLLVNEINEIIKLIHSGDSAISSLALKPKSINNVSENLMNDWIPTSQIYTNKILEIEKYFKQFD